MDTKDMIAVLNDLLHVSKDGEKTFHRALQITDDGELELAFRTALRSCMLAAQQLSLKIHDLGGTPSRHGTVPGMFRRAWIDARTTLAREEDAALLGEIVRAERTAVEHYDEALERSLADDVQSLVESQAAGAKANLRRFEELAAARKPAAEAGRG